MKSKNPLEEVQKAAWHYLWEKANPQNGLVADQTGANSPASIAVTGMALSALPIAVENGWITRPQGAARALATLRFFAHDAQQQHGFFFHFLDMESGQRVWNCELSSIDSAILFLGVLLCGAFFDSVSAAEREIRELSEQISARADWNWFRNGDAAVSIAWKPERGFSKHHWRGYNEALLLYFLGLGSPTHALPEASYIAWLKHYHWRTIYGIPTIYCGPMFVHLFNHLWFDLRDFQDAWTRQHNFNYWDNTISAIQIQSEWAKRRGHPQQWGVSACDGPNLRKNGGYHARSVPFGHFDEVYSPPVCLASHPFAPEVVTPAWGFWNQEHSEMVGKWGVRGAIHTTSGWMSEYFGLDQGLLVLTAPRESNLLHELARAIPVMRRGLERAGVASE